MSRLLTKYLTKKNHRVTINLEDALVDIPGNIIEIGAGNGDSTKQFAIAAKKLNRKVIVIDPFEDGWDDMPESYRYNYKYFLSTMKPYMDYLIEIRKPSQDPDVVKKLVYLQPIAFAFVDGLQTKDAVLNDLWMCAFFKIPIIGVDDVNRMTGDSQVPVAVIEFLAESEYEFEKYKGREAYLVRPDYFKHK